jgi:carboxymethylenebutenolidase
MATSKLISLEAGHPGTPGWPAVLARPPQNQDRGAGIVVLHDVFGLGDDIRRVLQRLADEGYWALAPDLMAGRGPRLLCVAKLLGSLKNPNSPFREQVREAIAWLRTQPGIGHTAVMGFCIGGGYALMAGTEGDVTVAATFYGPVPPDIGELPRLCPIIGGYGEKDRLFYEQGRRLQRHLIGHGVEHDLRFYPDAGHSYMNRHDNLLFKLARYTPMAAAPHDEAEADSWQRLFGFLERHFRT